MQGHSESESALKVLCRTAGPAGLGIGSGETFLSLYDEVQAPVMEIWRYHHSRFCKGHLLHDCAVADQQMKSDVCGQGLVDDHQLLCPGA